MAKRKGILFGPDENVFLFLVLSVEVLFENLDSSLSCCLDFFIYSCSVFSALKRVLAG